MSRTQRVVLMLAISQVLFQTGSVLLATVGGLAGLMLAPTGLLATLPLSMVPVGTMLGTIPASLLMARIGRKRGFVLGAALGAGGGVLATTAMMISSFPMLCAGTLLIGLYQGFAQFYRFAAATASPKSGCGRPITAASSTAGKASSRSSISLG